MDPKKPIKNRVFGSTGGVPKVTDPRPPLGLPPPGGVETGRPAGPERQIDPRGSRRDPPGVVKQWTGSNNVIFKVQMQILAKKKSDIF